MLIETMTLQEMRCYQGINPKPADFDVFWDEGIRRALRTDPQTELIPAKFQAKGTKCFHLYYRGEDGARIHAKYLCPEQPGPHPVLFLFHGYPLDSGDWSGKLGWVQQGFTVVAMDCRGQAGLSQDMGGVHGTTYRGHIVRGLLDGPEQLLYYHIFLDIVVLVNTVRRFAEVDETRMAAQGGSQGGALALVCAALNPDIKKVAVNYPFLCDYKRVWDLGGYEELKAFFRAHDPRHERETEFFTRLGYIDVQHMTPRIRARVLWKTALEDQNCPASTQFAAYNHLKTEKQMVLYPDFGHEYLPGSEDEEIEFLAFD